MNAFERIVSFVLEEKGYWIRTSVKPNLTRHDKIIMGKPSMPRPEIDLVAYNPQKNELILIECKSPPGLSGVSFPNISGENKTGADRYKLFTHPKFREIISKRIRREYLEAGLINRKTRIRFGLAAGKIWREDDVKIKNYFLKKKWVFISPEEIRHTLLDLSSGCYEDSVIHQVVKLISRKGEPRCVVQEPNATRS